MGEGFTIKPLEQKPLQLCVIKGSSTALRSTFYWYPARRWLVSFPLFFCRVRLEALLLHSALQFLFSGLRWHCYLSFASPSLFTVLLFRTVDWFTVLPPFSMFAILRRAAVVHHIINLSHLNRFAQFSTHGKCLDAKASTARLGVTLSLSLSLLFGALSGLQQKRKQQLQRQVFLGPDQIRQENA